MRVENLRTVRNNLSGVIENLPATGPVLITRSGRPRAILLAVSEETDLEALLLSTSARFWKLFDRASRSRRWTKLEELP